MGAEVSMMQISLDPRRYGVSINGGTANKLHDFAEMTMRKLPEARLPQN